MVIIFIFIIIGQGIRGIERTARLRQVVVQTKKTRKKKKKNEKKLCCWLRSQRIYFWLHKFNVFFERRSKPREEETERARQSMLERKLVRRPYV